MPILAWQCAVLLIALSLPLRPVNGQQSVQYCDITATVASSSSSLSSTGVFAVFSPVYGVGSARLYQADPWDACTLSTPPNVVRPFAILARWLQTSNCTYVDQVRNAQAIGASALLNMAAQRSNFVFVMDTVAADAGKPMPTIPAVAVTGDFGLRLTDALPRGVFVRLDTSKTEELAPWVSESVLRVCVDFSCFCVRLL
jgi:hypothetical protein